jgi:crotonobetainyl-CoA:carnitine CoA-transferase CaiB-like acyl-CoA transferase
MDRALEGIRIVDAGAGPAAGYGTRLLALLGADVIKVERPGTGDVLRRAGPFPGDRPHREASGPHLHLNAAKRSVTVDATTATGAALVRRLLDRADAFVSNSADALHPSLAPAALEQSHPRLVVASITPFGASGPRSGWRGRDLVAMAAGGYLSLNGDPDREPVAPYGPQAEHQAGSHAAIGIVAALRARARDGAGQAVDAAAAEASAFLTAGALQRFALMRRPQVRNGARPAGFAANRLYPSTVRPCADGHVHVHCHNRFHDLISVLMHEPRLAAPEILDEPLGHADEIDALMDRWLVSRTRAEAVGEAQELRVPMTEVLDPAEVLALEHLRERGFLGAAEHPVAGSVLRLGPPWREVERDARTGSAAAPAVPQAPRAPLLGEHNAAILRDELGLTARDLARLAAAGVV